MQSRPTARVTFLWVVMLSVLMVGACGGDQPRSRVPHRHHRPAAPPHHRQLRSAFPSRSRYRQSRCPRKTGGQSGPRRAQSRFTSDADFLRVRQFGSRRRRSSQPDAKRRPAEAIRHVGRDDWKAIATSAAPPNTTWPWGERRALAARHYLTTLGVSADRVRTVSYGKNFRSIRGMMRQRGRATGAPIS